MTKQKKRKNLHKFRIDLDLSQKQMAARLNYSFSQYSLIERGYRNGTHEFWAVLQREFEVPDADMWQLMKRG